MKSGNKHEENYKIPRDILDDLATRFIINVPEDRNDIIRMCFNMEKAHWFYLDYYCNDKIMPCGIKKFAFQLFQHVPFLSVQVDKLTDILNHFKQYKRSVRTYGAILMNSNLDKVLLVQSYGTNNFWGFPKGKVNEDEESTHCAIREVLEETGYDITKLINPDMYIEKLLGNQYTKVYIVQNVPTETVFVPRTKMEIKSCEWFNLEYLPTNRYDTICKLNLGINANSFFMIIPFVKDLKRLLVKQKGSLFETKTENQQPKNVNNKLGNSSTNVSKKRQQHKSLGAFGVIKPLSGFPTTFQQYATFSTNINSTEATSNSKAKENIKYQLFTVDETSTENGDFGVSVQYFCNDNANHMMSQSLGKRSDSKIISSKPITSQHLIQLPNNSTLRKALVPIDDFINSDPYIDKWKHFTFDFSKLLTF